MLLNTTRCMLDLLKFAHKQAFKDHIRSVCVCTDTNKPFELPLIRDRNTTHYVITTGVAM